MGFGGLGWLSGSWAPSRVLGTRMQTRAEKRFAFSASQAAGTQVRRGKSEGEKRAAEEKWHCHPGTQATKRDSN